MYKVEITNIINRTIEGQMNNDDDGPNACYQTTHSLSRYQSSDNNNIQGVPIKIDIVQYVRHLFHKRNFHF